MANSSRFLTMASRLNLLRMKMVEHGLSAYIIPTSDAHGSEYIAECDKRVEYISGFTGSSGTCLITKEDALLFTDSRYYIQAEKQLERSIWKLIRHGQPGVPTIMQWIISKFASPKPSGSDSTAAPESESALNPDDIKRATPEPCSELKAAVRIGVNDSVISNVLYKMWRKELKPYDMVLVAIEHNLVDEIWLDRPPRANNPLIILSPTFTGVFWSTKLTRVIEMMRERGAEILVVTALDEIAYLLNLRGSDITYNPVFFSFLIVTLDGVHIFMDDQKLRGTPGIVDHLTSPRIKTFLHGYDEFYDELGKLSTSCVGRIWVDPFSSQRLLNCLKVDKKRLCIAPSPVSLMKMCKTPEEVAGIRRAHINDSIALCRFLYLLSEAMEYGRVDGLLALAPVRAHLEKLQQQENIIPAGQSGSLTSDSGQIKFTMTECLAAEILDYLRSQESDFVSLSFETISASGPNGAIIHYKPQPSSDRPLSKKELYLVDSGGQYMTGTTDVTRTVHFGVPTEEERIHFTLVLKGVLDLQNAVFPSSTFGYSLDALARAPLWTHGLSFGHGVGHGVGAFLNVHEGPCGFRKVRSAFSSNEEGLRLNTVITIEPGYYKDDCYGIRIENVNLVVKACNKYLASTSKAAGIKPPVNSEEKLSPPNVIDKLSPGTAQEPAEHATAAENKPVSSVTTTTGMTSPSNISATEPVYLTFDPLTLVPIQRKMIMASQLTAEEITTLNAYHGRCRQVVIPVLIQRNLHEVVHWLKYETQPL